jgi:hypothetical protein
MTAPNTAGGEGGAGGSSSGGGGNVRTETVYVDANVESIAARYGGKDAAIKKLWRDNKAARDKRREAEEARDKAINDGKVKDGEIRLVGDDAKAWTAFKALGKKPEEISTIITQHGELSQKVQGTERKEVHSKAAKAAGYQNVDALSDLAETKKLNIVLKKERVNDQDVEVPYVQPGEQGAAPVKLTEYVDQHLSVYKPALLAPSAAGTQNGASGASTGTRSAHPEQSSAAASTGGNNQAKPGALPLRDTRVLPSQRNAPPAK